MNKKALFTGCAPALITPFRDGAVDEAAFLLLIDRQLKGGCEALVICGTTGESSTLTDDERFRLLELAVREVNGRVPVIAGAGSNNTQRALTMIRQAEHAGADGLLLVTPYYNKTTQAGLIAHFTYLADRTDLPIILYEVPSRTGVTIAPETIAKLSRHPRIIGIKEAGTDLDRISRAILLSEPDFVFYSGNDSLALPLFALGAKGLISVASNLLPAEFGALCRFCLDGRYSEAARLHYRYFPLMDALFCEVNPIPVKTASSLMGLCTSDIRLPLIGPSDAHRDLIQARLMEVGLI
jgi:4-hydroxy-tetrahydrodipicolinate synthase